MGGRRRKFCCVGGRAQIGKAGLSKNAGSLGTPRERDPKTAEKRALNPESLMDGLS